MGKKRANDSQRQGQDECQRHGGKLRNTAPLCGPREATPKKAKAGKYQKGCRKTYENDRPRQVEVPVEEALGDGYGVAKLVDVTQKGGQGQKIAEQIADFAS